MSQSLTQWLTYIETLHPNTIELGLARVKQVAQQLDILNFSCPVITIAGTNGKGSCVAFLAAILQAQGYRVGAYTSPHLLQFNERIQIAGQMATDEAIVAALAQVEQARGQLNLTYFEFTTLAALILFQQAQPEVILLEIGLGGRLDAVNIVEPDICILTTLALDHMDWLGDTREAIAAEKAAIFRSGKPAICGDFAPPANVLSIAQAVQAPLYCVNRDFFYQIQADTWQWHSADTQLTQLPLPQLPVQNAATALMAIALLQPRLPVTQTAIAQGLAMAQVPGRFQQFTRDHAHIVLDVAHNPAAAQLLAQRLRQQPCVGKTLAVFAVLADKDIAAILSAVSAEIAQWFIAGLAVPRGSTVAILENHLQNLGISAYHKADSISAAFKQAVDHCQPKDRIVVFGSFHTVAPVLAYLRENNHGTQI